MMSWLNKSAIPLILGCLSILASGQSLPYTVPSFEVGIEADVVYGTAEGYWSHAPEDAWDLLREVLHQPRLPHPVGLKMDIYLPEGDDSPTRPLLLMMHGGGFFIGNKNEPGQTEWCRYFASLGYVAASIDYRMGYRLKKGALSLAERLAEEDAADALGFLLDREDLRIDRSRIFVAGTSAGAALALSLAFQWAPDRPDCTICAVGNFWGYVHDLSVLENARTPILSFQSEKDPIVPYQEGYLPGGRHFSEKVYGTLAISRKAAALGIRCEHLPCPEKRHRLHLDKKKQFTPRFYEIRERMAVFFAEAMQSDG